eukprot:707114_1
MSTKTFRTLRLKLVKKEPNLLLIDLFLPPAVREAMFFGGMRESQLSETVVIDDVSPAAFEFILKYIYTGNVKDPSDADLVSIIYAAEKYQMCDIVDKCEQRLKWVLKISTACTFYVQTFGMFDKAAGICLKFILRYFDIIISRPSRVQNLSAACWESILSSDLSVSSEVKLFNSLLGWSKVSSQNREAVLKLIQMVRFVDMSSKEIADTVAGSGLFNPDEILEILQFKLLRRIKKGSFLGNMRGSTQPKDLNQWTLGDACSFL